MPDNCAVYPKRLLHLDILRLIAIFLVIFNHTGERGYMLFADRMDSALYYPYMLASVFCKVAVPIFFMISGALLLPKQESLGKLFSKRILRMVMVLLLISIPYYVWLHRAQGLRISSFLTFIYGNSASTSLWYLYSYIALLLMMPFLRNMVKTMKPQEFRYLILGYVTMFGVVPCMEYWLWEGTVTVHESFMPAFFLMPNLFYALVGYYLEHVAPRQESRRRMVLGFILSVIALAVTCFMTHYQTMIEGQCDGKQMERFFNCFICIPAMTLFDAMKCVGETLCGAKVRKILPVLGGTVFGIYLTEKFARALTDAVYLQMMPVVGSFAASLIWTFSTLCLSLVVITALKYTPGIKRIVNYFI